MMTKREIGRKLIEARRKGRVPGDPKVGERLLKEAKADIQNRRTMVQENVDSYSWEAADYIRNLARGRMLFYGTTDQYINNYDRINWSAK